MSSQDIKQRTEDVINAALDKFELFLKENPEHIEGYRPNSSSGSGFHVRMTSTNGEKVAIAIDRRYGDIQLKIFSHDEAKAHTVLTWDEPFATWRDLYKRTDKVINLIESYFDNKKSMIAYKKQKNLLLI